MSHLNSSSQELTLQHTLHPGAIVVAAVLSKTPVSCMKECMKDSYPSGKQWEAKTCLLQYYQNTEYLWAIKTHKTHMVLLQSSIKIS